MPTTRPEINEDLVRKVKMKYPKETALLGVAETVEWALKQVLKNDFKQTTNGGLK